MTKNEYEQIVKGLLRGLLAVHKTYTADAELDSEGHLPFLSVCVNPTDAKWRGWASANVMFPDRVERYVIEDLTYGTEDTECEV